MKDQQAWTVKNGRIIPELLRPAWSNVPLPETFGANPWGIKELVMLRIPTIPSNFFLTNLASWKYSTSSNGGFLNIAIFVC